MTEWKEIASTYLPMEGGVLHPDECFKMRIKGAEWSVRPLYPPEGVRFTPSIDGENVSFSVDVGGGDATIQKAAEDLIKDLPEHLEGTTLVLDAADAAGYLARVCKYVMMLLDQQYNLTIEQKIELLSFRGNEAPTWVEYGIRHAQSMPPEPPEDVEETDGD